MSEFNTSLTQNLAQEPTNAISTQTSATESGGNDSFDIIEKKLIATETLGQKIELFLDHLRRVSTEEKVFFTKDLGVMIKSGLPTSRAIRTLALQSGNAKFKRVLFSVYRSVEKGDYLADSLKRYPRVFPEIFISMIKAGENSGQLENVLSELTKQLKRAHDIRHKIKSAMMYPAAILVAMIGIGSAMIIFVIPKLISIFEEFQAELPLPTKILIAVTHGVNKYLLIVLPTTIILISLIVWLAHTPPGKKVWHKMILLMPVVKSIARKINLAKISQTLGSLMKTEMPIVDSINLTVGTINNVYYKNSLAMMALAVEKGKTISSQMALHPSLYPPVVLQMVAVGEETGEIASILDELSKFYEEDVSQTMDSLPSLIEPILIVTMGVVVGGMAVAVIMPMFTLTQSI